MSGFRYVLELENREPADPAMFITALPPGMWKPGDQFMAASDLRQFRIVDFAELENPDVEFVHGVWIIEPVEGKAGSARVNGRSRRSNGYSEAIRESRVARRSGSIGRLVELSLQTGTALQTFRKSSSGGSH